MLEQENEGLENTDVEESSSETPEASQDAAPAKEAAQPKEPEIDWAKAFEHPRFKELNTQRNEAVERAKAFEAKLAQLENRFSESQAPKGPTAEQTELESLISDLKKVDPRLAAQIEHANKASQSVTQLQQRLETFEKQSAESSRQAQVKEAVGKINQLHETNKLSPEAREILNSKFDNLYMQGKLNLQNLDTEYKNALDGFNKFIEGVKRSEKESYVASKKADAGIPASQPKGTPAKPGAKKPTWSKDPETARQQIVNRFLKQQAANKEASSV